MAYNAIPAANVAPFIPELWSVIVQKEAESELTFANLVDRRFEPVLTYGDTLNVPIVCSMGDAQTVNPTVDLTLWDSIQACVAIVVNYHYQQSLGLATDEQAQDRPDILQAFLPKCAFSVAKMIDDKLADLVNGLGKSEGTEGSALTADVLINCYTDLNLNNVPDSDRCWIFDPYSIQDLLKLDYFVRYDYVPEGVVSKGFEGRQIFGAPVYRTANLNVINTSYHAAVYMHREALALIEQIKPRVFSFYWPEKFTNVVGVEALFGVKEMRDTYGIWVKTRN